MRTIDMMVARARRDRGGDFGPHRLAPFGAAAGRGMETVAHAEKRTPARPL